MENIDKAIEIVESMPSVKIGLDDFYGKQTVLKAINTALNMRKVSISATEKAQLISSLSQLLIDNKGAGLYKQLQTDCVNKLELLVSSIEL